MFLVRLFYNYHKVYDKTMLDMYVFFRILFYVVLGFCVGSFLNVIIYRLPIMLSSAVSKKMIGDNHIGCHKFRRRFDLCFPNSFCPHCYCPIPLKYNIPLFGWLFLRGTSQCCHRKINPRYVIIEIITALLTLAVSYFSSDDYVMIASLVLIWGLIALTFIDLDCYLLPDNITLPLLWIGILININDTFSPLSFSVVGAAAGYIFLWFPYFLFKVFKGIDGMGYGDFKLMAALGAWFGVAAIPFLILLSSCLGIISYIFIYYFSNNKLKHIAFGPYIALSGGIYLFFGDQITFLF